MNVERQLHIVMAALAALGSLLLGMGQQSSWLPLIAASCSALSLYFTDITGVFHLHRHLANGFSLLAVILSIREFYHTTSEDQLLAIANLLIYLQLVLLFQQKSDRVYWQLIVLSVLQVVVAAALNLGFEFGVLLAVYLVVVLTALFLFFLHRETRLRPEENPEGETSGWEAIAPLSELLADKADAIDTDVSEAPSFVQVVRRGSDGRVAPAKSRPLPIFGMAREIGLMVLTTAIFAIVIFYSVPRTSEASWRLSGGRRNSRVGFSPEVNLADSGQIGADETAALRISFWSADGQEPYMMPEAPYIRGAVLSRYTNRTWKNPWLSGSAPFQAELEGAPQGAEVVRQELVLESPQERSLFAVFPINRLPATDDNIRFDPRSQRLFTKDQDSADFRRSSHFRYVLATTAFRHGVQADLSVANDIPPYAPLHELGSRRFTRQLVLQNLQEIPPLVLDRVKELADRILVDVPAADPMRRAQVLENHFRLSTEYQYTLDFDSVKRNKEIDPVEDFCLNHKKGNCRYFASALALMLRTQGIPSRMVVGFRGGEYNSLGHFFVVRQKHAHAWVEAYLRRDQIPDTMIPAGMESAEGFWLRLDPTPIDGQPLAVSAEVGVLAYIGECLGYAQLLWSDYVVQLNSERQQEAIFRPLIDRVAETTSELVGADSWRDRISQWADAAGLARDGWLAHYWYVWLTLAMVLGSAGIGLLLKWGQNWWWPYVARFFGSSSEKRGRQGASIPFFRRLEQLLASYGWTRRAGQTQREFANALKIDLSKLPQGASAADLVEKLVDGYYSHRYGGGKLSAAEESRYDKLLASLERDLKIATSPKLQSAAAVS